MMINKENKRRKTKYSKKESRTQTRKERRRKRNFIIFKNRHKGEGQKVEDYTGKERNRKEQGLTD